MASTFTNTLELELQAAGDNSGTWGDPTLNQNVFARIDAWAGGTVTVALASSNVTLTQTQWRNACIKLTGTLGANVDLRFPLNVNSATVAVGGTRVIDNQCDGNFTVTVKTIAVGSTGVIVPQGVRSVVYSDTANVTFADDRLGNTDILRVPTTAGSPNGSLSGIVGTAFKPGSLDYDRTNNILYGASADGTSGWVPQSGYFPNPQGYLTPTSGTAIITGDVVAATSIYYTPYVGNMVPIYDGSWLIPYFISELTLTLTSSQAANQIYDIFAFRDSGTTLIGTGPAWATPTAGSGARGTGSGTTQISRINGLWTNAVSMTARNGASTYSVGANQGTYLGSLAIDATNGQASFYRSWGQSRKWALSNAYNRVPIILQAGDNTPNWAYATVGPRASNDNSANACTLFCGLAEEVAMVTFNQRMNAGAGPTFMGIGWNTISFVGFTGKDVSNDCVVQALYVPTPFLGINNAICLESSAASTTTYYGGQASMMMTAQWRG